MRIVLGSPAALAAVLVICLVALLSLLALLWGRFYRYREPLYRIANRFWQWLDARGIPARRRERYPRASAFVAARLSPSSYLGLHLTVGLVLSVAALVFFGAIADDIADRSDTAILDDSIRNWFGTHSTIAGTHFFKAVSFVGEPVVVAALGAFVAVVLLLRREFRLLLGWVAGLCGGGVLDVALKLVFHRQRPPIAGQFLHGHSWSFPSGHAMGSVVAFGMLAYLVSLRVRSWRVRFRIFAGTTVLVVLIGLSRLYLGVHFFTDVIGGYAAGVSWLAACISGTEIARRRASEQAVTNGRPE